MPTIEQVLEEIEAREREIRSGAKQTTPLLQYMKDRKDEKIKKREDQRESRYVYFTLYTFKSKIALST